MLWERVLPSKFARIFLGVFLLSLVSFVVGPANRAWASNFGSTACGGAPRNCVSLGDNNYHTWYPEGVLGNQIPGMDVAVQVVMDDYERSTVLTTVKVQSSTLDVLVTDYPYGDNGLAGWAECLPGSPTSGSHPSRRCDRQKLRFNSDYPASFDTFDDRRAVACHELGHTVGLRHTALQSSCMKNPPNGSAPFLSTHDINHINTHHQR
jgi:hypothetical protein